MQPNKPIRGQITTLGAQLQQNLLPNVRKGISKSKNGLFADKTARYHWKMTMNPDQSVREMRGYGKIEGHNENHSKIQNLMRIFLMLHEKGYFERTSRIEIRERGAAALCSDRDPVRLIITPGNILYNPTFKDYDDIPFAQFLTNFEMCIKNGVNPKVHLRPTNTK